MFVAVTVGVTVNPGVGVGVVPNDGVTEGVGEFVTV